jgi:hypothetical protein
MLLSAAMIVLNGSSKTCAASMNSGSQDRPAQPAGTCSFQKATVLEPYAVAVYCDNKVTAIPDGSGTLESVSAPGTLSQSVQVAPSHTFNTVLIVYWSPAAAAQLKGGGSYKFTLTYDPNGPNHDLPALVVPIAPAETISLSPGFDPTKPVFTFTSNVAFSLDGHTLAIPARSTSKQGVVLWRSCSVQFASSLFKQSTYSAQCERLQAVSMSTYSTQCERLQAVPKADPVPLSALQCIDPTFPGQFEVKLPSFPGIPLIPVSPPYQDVLGGTPKFDPKARLARPSAPASQDVAHEYLNANYSDGVGSTPAWIVIGKYAPTLAILQQFLVGPLITANIGNGTVQGQTATDAIDLGGSASRFFNGRGPLDAYKLSLGATYETDRHFDRDNLLGTVDVQLFSKYSNKTQQRQAQQLWAQLLTKDKTAQLSDISLYRFLGYEFDIHGGIEGGGALATRVIKATKGGAEAILPTFPILRIVPQVHGLLQINRISLDELVVGRYLTTTEKTIVQTPSDSLYLKNVTDWQALSTLTGTFALDPQGNFGLTVTYLDGVSPPTYKRVNSVQAGLTIKY